MYTSALFVVHVWIRGYAEQPENGTWCLQAMSALEAGVATWRRGLALVATLALLTHGILLTRARVRDWHDDLTLYKSAVLVCPGSAKNHHQLGLLYASAGNFSAAMEEYMRARHIDPEFCDVDQSIGARPTKCSLHLH